MQNLICLLIFSCNGINKYNDKIVNNRKNNSCKELLSINNYNNKAINNRKSNSGTQTIH